MTKQAKQNYGKFRACGMDAKQAMRAARILTRFNELGEECVRMRAEEDLDGIAASDVESWIEGYERNGHADPKEGEKEANRLLADGVWGTISEYFDGQEWQQADSCWGHWGYKDVLSPFENWYVVDEMQAAIEAFEACQSKATVEAFA